MCKESSTTEALLSPLQRIWVVCSEAWFQESCLGLGEIYLFIILINDTFFLLDLLGTE